MAPKRRLQVVAPPPPGKRPRAAEAAPGRGGLEPPTSPGKRLRAVMLLVLFIKIRPKPISTSQFGRLIKDQLCHFLNPMFSKLETKLEGKLERIEERIQDLTTKVDNMTQSSPYSHNHERFIQETNQEGNKAQAGALSTVVGQGKNTSIQLRFLNGVKTHVFHDDEIKSESDTPIKIGIFDGEKMIESGGLSNLEVEIFALEGDFPHTSPKSWNAKKFNKHRANARDGRGNVLAGEGTKAQLKNGHCDLGCIKFREGSCRAHRGKFIIAARVSDAEVSGVRVQEAVMNPVVVQDRRNKTNRKCDVPELDDRVHRLNGITKGGTYCKRLEAKNIFTVEAFLKAQNKDPDELANILQIQKEHGAWKKMVEHAKKCRLKPELKSYRCTDRNVVLFFNCVHDLVGAAFCGHYTARNKFDENQQHLVDKLKRSAYDQLDDLHPDHIMTRKDNFPRPLDTAIGASSSAATSYMPSRLAEQFGGVPADEGLSHAQIEPSTATRDNNPGPSSSTPDHHNTQQHHGQGIRPACQEQFSAPLNSLYQNPVRKLNSCNRTTEDSHQEDADDFVMGLLNLEAESILSWQDNDTLEASTSDQDYTILTTEQPATVDASGSAQARVQNYTQVPLAPSNGTSEAFGSAPQPLPPQQWSQYHGPGNGPF